MIGPLSTPQRVKHGEQNSLRRAVRLAVEPENLRGINAVNTRQRIVAVLIAVDVGQRHISVHFLQQAEPFPDKPACRLADRPASAGAFC